MTDRHEKKKRHCEEQSDEAISEGCGMLMIIFFELLF